MNKHKKMTIIMLIIGIVIIAGCTQTQHSNVVKEIEEPIKIAFISSLTGDAGIWGQQVKKGFDFALDEINSQGGINNKKIKVIYEDDECDAKTGTSVFDKIIYIDKADIITGTVCSSVAMASMNDIIENDILYIVPAATSPEITKQSDNVFRLWVSDDYEAKALAEYAADNLQLEKVAILSCSDQIASKALEENFIETFKKENREITGTEKYISTDKDVKTQLTKLMSKNPEAIYLLTPPEQTALFIKQLKDLGYKGKILTYSPAITSEGVIEQINNKENIYYVSAVSKEETNFWGEYKQKTGEDADALVALGYDSMKIIEAGLKQCGENNDCIRDYFFANEFPLSRGTIKFDKHGDLTGVKFAAHKV